MSKIVEIEGQFAFKNVDEILSWVENIGWVGPEAADTIRTDIAKTRHMPNLEARTPVTGFQIEVEDPGMSWSTACKLFEEALEHRLLTTLQTFVKRYIGEALDGDPASVYANMTPVKLTSDFLLYVMFEDEFKAVYKRFKHHPLEEDEDDR